MIFIYVLITYFITEAILRKLLTVEHKEHFFIYPHDTKRFRYIENMIMLIFTLAILLTIFQFYNDPKQYTYSLTLVFLLQFLVWSVRGAEQWFYKPQTKQYISSWLGALLMFLYACIFYFL